MAQPTDASSHLYDRSDNPMIADQQAAIAVVTDSLNGATFTGETLLTSATPTVDELETIVGSLAGKVNAILVVLKNHGLIAD